jgi:hypothetical protein
MQMQAGRPEAFEGDINAVHDRELHKDLAHVCASSPPRHGLIEDSNSTLGASWISSVYKASRSN